MVEVKKVLFEVLTLMAAVSSSAESVAPYYFGPPKARQAATNRRFTGIPSICATPGGRLWATWYAGPTPAEDLNNYIVLATSADGGKTWKEVLVTDPDEGGPSRCFDANLWVTPDGRLQWNWSERLPGYGGAWGSDGDRVFVRYGDNPESETMGWTERRVVGEGVAMGKSLRLSSGEWVMPVCKWFGEPSSRMYVSADNGTTWTCRGGVAYPRNPRQFDEHQFVENADGVLQCFSRTYLGIGHSVSRDRGRTWTPGELTWIPQPCSRFFVRRLRSGCLLMVKHGPMKMDLDWSFCGRERLMAFLSYDDGATWKGALMLDERKTVSYPDGDQLPDGSVVVVYDRERTDAREILMARFTEADVLAGKIVSAGSSLKNLVSKGSFAGETDGHPACFSPEAVATPPTFARRDLCVTADGEIRHYGVRLGADGQKQRVYIASRDGGRNWATHVADPNDVGAVWKSPWSDRWIALGDGKGTNAVCAFVSLKGPGDTAFRRLPQKEGDHCEPRQPVALKSRKRWIVPASAVGCERGYEARVFLSDDDGTTWRMVKVPDTVPLPVKRDCDATALWRNPGCEPTVTELSDGTLLLAVRASEGHHWFFRSHDAGETWQGPECVKSFYACNTMPLFLKLRDGRMLFFWNNTDPLPKPSPDGFPELSEGELSGSGETAFTNRDVLHAAISEDDGRTWIGFREITLNPIRNEPDFRERGNFPDQELDKSVHQSQAMELPDGKVMLAAGQNVASRRIYVFDPKWLYETDRTEDFRHGLENLTTHLYVRSLSGGWRGWAGHCCWNRVSGALLVRDPFEVSNRELLQLCRIRDPRLLSDVQGVAWNFPASRTGVVTVETRVEGAGFRLSLCDRWFNASDPRPADLSLVSVAVDDRLSPRGAWHAVSVRWDCDAGTAEIAVDGKTVRSVRLKDLGSSFGPSYLHLQTLAAEADPKGSYFRSFTKRGMR